MAELEAIAREKLDAKHEIRQVLDKYADLHGISPKVINELVWGYVDDLLGDMFFELRKSCAPSATKRPISADHGAQSGRCARSTAASLTLDRRPPSEAQLRRVRQSGLGIQAANRSQVGARYQVGRISGAGSHQRQARSCSRGVALTGRASSARSPKRYRSCALSARSSTARS